MTTLSINLAALNSVGDPNVRMVLEGLVNSMVLVTAPPDQNAPGAAVTREQLAEILGPDTPTPGVIKTWNGPLKVLDKITSAAADVATDPAFLALQGTVTNLAQQTGQVATALSEEVTQRTNAVAAVAEQVSQVSAAVSTDIAAAVQVESEARANADGDILAKYAVKVDINGHVSGYGLIAEDNGAEPISAFIVSADRFAIAHPLQEGGNAVQIPFIVENNRAYIDSALIGKLQAGSIEVEKLAGTSTAFQSPGTYSFTTTDEFRTILITVNAGGGGGGKGEGYGPAVSGSTSWAAASWSGGRGGYGGRYIILLENVTPGTVIGVNVGDGGNPYNSGSGGYGFSGGQSSITINGSQFIAFGGAGGNPAEKRNSRFYGFNGANGTAGADGQGGGSGPATGGGAPGGAGEKRQANINAAITAPAMKGSSGSVSIEAYNPNGVVLRHDWETLILHLNQRLTAYTWP